MIALALAAPAHADPGDLDPSFGDGGVAAVQRTREAARALAVQPDGKIVIAGTRLVRFDAEGGLDTTFGAGGIVTLDPPAFTQLATDVQVASDGRIFVPWAWFSATGALEAEFTHPGLDYAQAIRRLPDGRLLVAGTTGEVIGLGPLNFAVARFLEDGTRDSAFGVDGATRANFARYGDHIALDMAVQSDGRIVVVGVSAFADGFVVVRFLAGGGLDTSFGTDGVVIVPGTTDGYSVLVEPDDRILVGGMLETAPQGAHAAIARLLANGDLDPTFGVGGIATFPPVGAPVTALTRQPNGKLLAAARDLFRTEPSGTLDCTFGRAGVVRTDATSRAHDVAVLADGRVLTAGEGRDPDLGPTSTAARYEGGDERLDACGNCVVDDDEDCDDGNEDDTDACLRTCTSNPCFTGPDTTPCDDDDPCTSNDRCAAGLCVGDAMVCPLCERCDAGRCLAAVRNDCRRSIEPTRSTLRLDRRPDGRSRLVWRWREGEHTPAGAFGLPTRGDALTMCVFDESDETPRTLVGLRTLAPGNCPRGLCWRETRAGGFVYRRRDGSPDGVTNVRLQAGAAGKATIAFEARGPHLELPTTPLPLPLRVQLEGDAGGCFATEHDGAARNDATRVRSRATR